MPKRKCVQTKASPPVKKSHAAPGPQAAAAGASSQAEAPVAPLSIAELLETESTTQSGQLTQWVRKAKNYVDQALLAFLKQNKREVSFAVPAQCSMIPPLAITQAASGASLSAFREVMNYDNLIASFSRTSQYEAAGTVWMLDPTCADIDDVTISQLEGATGMWAAETHVRSSTKASLRRVSFDVPLPVKVVDAKVAQRAEDGKSGVCVTQPLTMLAGRAVVITWYSAMCEALQQSNHDRVWHLFNAALSVPINMRLLPDGDASTLAALSFSDTMFASYAASGADSFWKLAEKACRLSGVQEAFSKQESVSKLESVLKTYGLVFKGKPLTNANVFSLKGLHHFVLDGACRSAFALAEAYSPELREPTLLARIATSCSSRAVSDAKAKEYFVYVMNCLRVARLTGDLPKEEKLTVGRVVGRDRKTPAMIHAFFKKKELVEYVFHEGRLMDKDMHGPLAMFESPLKIMQRFAASGADGLVASYRNPESRASDGMDPLFALQVATYRDGMGPKPQAMIDLVWPLWSGAFDDEVQELTSQDMHATAASAGFLWHTYLNGTSHELGVKYRAFVAACAAGPIPAGPEQDENLGLTGISELGQDQKEELQKLQEKLKLLRRKTVAFVALPTVGAASGADFAVAQMQIMWEGLSLGHRFGGKTGDVRAFVVSAELFPPNVIKQGPKARLSEPTASDEAKFKRVLEFVASKRAKDDVIILFDGRGRANRRVIEGMEHKLATGSHLLVECWCVYVQPKKKQDPRAAFRSSGYTINNKETAYFSLPIAGAGKVVHRTEFNSCGESSSAATTYTGISMRRLSELPRMSHETKTSILGAPACAELDTRLSRLQEEVNEKGHPFAYAEVKPISFWQTIMEHHGVTHIVDFSPGSGALAVAASGAIRYEGVAANDAHRDWLDSIVDRCVMYKAGHVDGYAEQLGGDAEFVEKASKFFGGTMMEARRLLEPDVGEGGDDDEDGDGDVGSPAE